MRLVYDSETTIQENMGGIFTASMVEDVGKLHLKRQEENTSEAISSRAQAPVTTEAARDEMNASVTRSQFQKKGMD